MKVVLFCGGRGMRLRGYSSDVPKPMVPIGYRPILWHVMKYYAHFGHKDFILALGHQSDVIKRFFLEYEEAVTNDFVLRGGGREKELLGTDIDDWTITFVDTGTHANIGERLRRVRDYLGEDDLFLANYADGVTNLDLNAYISSFLDREQIAGFLAVPSPQSYHVVSIDDNENATRIGPISEAGFWINAGYFVLRQEIFDHMKPGDDIVNVLERLAANEDVYAHRFEGFWSPMDTFKDKTRLDSIFESGPAPWLVWKNGTA